MLKYETPIMQLMGFSSEDVLTDSWTPGAEGEGPHDPIEGDFGDLKMINIFRP